MKLFILVTIFQFSSVSFGESGGHSSVIEKEFEATSYACFQGSLNALTGAVLKIQNSAEAWCESLSGRPIFAQDPDTIEVKIIKNKDFDTGCRGNAYVKAVFRCSVFVT